MKSTFLAAVAALVSAASTPAAAWEVIGARNVGDRTDRDTMIVKGDRLFTRIKICVYRKPVHFYDVDISFANGGDQDVAVRARVNPGTCTRVIDLEAGPRDIEQISFLYEETSFKRRTATVTVYGE